MSYFFVKQGWEWQISIFPEKVSRIFATFQREMLYAAGNFREVLWITIMGSTGEASERLSYTAVWQTLNSLCKQKRQALSSIKTLHSMSVTCYHLPLGFKILIWFIWKQHWHKKKFPGIQKFLISYEKTLWKLLSFHKEIFLDIKIIKCREQFSCVILTLNTFSGYIFLKFFLSFPWVFQKKVLF